MISENSIGTLIGGRVIDRDGDKIGSIEQVYVDTQTGQPSWVSVKTGLFGTSESFVPLDEATEEGGDLRVPFEKSFVKDAPRIEADSDLSPAEEERLYEYYGATGPATTTGTVGQTDTTVGRTAGTGTDDAMTRSEERLNVGTERVETGRARLRKYVVTEQQQVEVPVTREEVRVEREPITDANRDAALDGPAISEDEHEVVLHEERPVVEKETVPVERVRLDADRVTGTETVDEEVRKEQIDVDGEGRGID